jgi:glycerol-3-phosphate dehydrogenase
MHNDTRMNLLIALTACQHGAAVANYVEVRHHEGSIGNEPRRSVAYVELAPQNRRSSSLSTGGKAVDAREFGSDPAHGAVGA